mgnify:CR=1 FL=1
MSDESLLHSKKKLQDFMASRKWVCDFVKRHGAISKVLHGEAGDPIISGIGMKSFLIYGITIYGTLCLMINQLLYINKCQLFT